MNTEQLLKRLKDAERDARETRNVLRQAIRDAEKR